MATAVGAKIYYALLNKDSATEQKNRQETLSNIAFWSGVAAFWSASVIAQAYVSANKTKAS